MGRSPEGSEGKLERLDETNRLRRFGGWLLGPLSSGHHASELMKERAKDQIRRDEDIVRALFDMIGQARQGIIDMHWSEASAILKRFVASKQHVDFEGLNPHQRAIVNDLQAAAKLQAAKPQVEIPAQRQSPEDVPQIIDLTATDKPAMIDLTKDANNPT